MKTIVDLDTLKNLGFDSFAVRRILFNLENFINFEFEEEVNR